MQAINTSILELGQMDCLANSESPAHRLDPRIKVITTLAYIIAVVSFGKYEVSALTTFMFYPAFLISVGNIPPQYILKNMMYAAPFAILIGILNPLFDQETLFSLGTIKISGGLASFSSIILRFMLTVSAVLALIATTGINNVCLAMEKMGTPRILVSQIQFLYRYIFILAHEAIRLSIARSLRSPGNPHTSIRNYSQILGSLLLRTMERASRIYLAMSARGFNGQLHSMTKLRIRPVDILFLLGWCSVFVIMRFVNIPQLLGNFLSGIL